MNKPFRLSCLAGWVARSAAAFFTLAICASSFAGEGGRNVAVTPKTQTLVSASSVQQRLPRKQVYLLISGSAIPQPIDRVAGPIATTAIPMVVIGNHAGD